MKTFVLSLALGAITLLSSATASAMPVTATANPLGLSSGSTVAFISTPKAFDASGMSVGTLVVTLTNSNGFGPVAPTLDLVKLSSPGFVATFTGGVSSFTANVFSTVFNVSAAQLASLKPDVTFAVQASGATAGTKSFAQLSAVPEPATMTLLGIGAVACCVVARRNRKNTAALAA